MSATVKLVERLLDRGRTLVERGQDEAAYQVLKGLAAFRDLSAEVAEETQALLAEIQIGRRKYMRARRHLAVALGYCPTNAMYHYLMAAAVDADDEADPQRALAHYRRSLKLDPDQPSCLVDYGLLCLELGRDRAGLRALRKAARLAPDNVEVLGAVVEGLCHLERQDEARRLLLRVRFHHARNPRFQKLWNDFQFQEARATQAAARLPQTGRTSGPELLPFVRGVKPDAPASPKSRRVRRDRPAPLPKPHGPRRLRIYEPK